MWDAGGPASNNADQYNTIIGGNLDLDPESSDTYSYGFILSPDFLPNFTMTLDYYDIKVEKAITSVNGETTLTACLTGNDVGVR